MFNHQKPGAVAGVIRQIGFEDKQAITLRSHPTRDGTISGRTVLSDLSRGSGRVVKGDRGHLVLTKPARALGQRLGMRQSPNHGRARTAQEVVLDRSDVFRDGS